MFLFLRADTYSGLISENTNNNNNKEVPALSDSKNEESAFDPKTGEINWDCPCLGGMAHGPCGEEFKAAFSCFVYSKEEPKGMECIEKFQAMQECFKKYPEIYNNEINHQDITENDNENEESNEDNTETNKIR
ncbi:hypothetical protein PCANB_002937 [Pneumocystis canis]|nr:hypothetical protein PCK1_002889 [Pneumocystis canis]KAG5438448.1 hypothetical protein PCANB_002937 [Pneumocystis canis]